MKARSRWFFAGGCGLAAAGASLLALQCAPNDDTTVSVVKDCKLDALNLSDPAEATVKVYVQTGTELRDRAKVIVGKFKDVCNAINKDLGTPLGDDVHLACNPIAERIQKANARAPVPDAGIPPVWASITFDDRPCGADAKATAACLDTCSGQAVGCDPAKSCSASEGKCTANCTGACSVTGTDQACRGGCFGECKSPNPDGGPEGGVPACAGECRGTCKSPTWTGRCSVGCKTGFIGVCSGVCTGSCDFIAFPFDAGGGGDAEAGAEGGLDAGAVADAGSGACNGICRGSCTGQASGSCTARCAGEFAGGACAGAGNCVGTCVGVGVPCVTTCSGSCETAGAVPGHLLGLLGTVRRPDLHGYVRLPGESHLQGSLRREGRARGEVRAGSLRRSRRRRLRARPSVEGPHGRVLAADARSSPRSSRRRAA